MAPRRAKFYGPNVPARARSAHSFDRRTILLTFVGAVLVVLPVTLVAEPVLAASWVRPGFNLTKQTQPNLPSLTDFVFLAGSNNLLAIGKCGEISFGTMIGGDLDNTSWSSVSWPSQANVTCAPL